MTLCFFGGWFGLHEFYLRKYLSGSLYLLFFWTFIPLLLSVIDFIVYSILIIIFAFVNNIKEVE